MNKEQLILKLQKLSFFEGNIELDLIEGFMTNYNYLVFHNNNTYVLKLGNYSEHYGVIRSHEIEASKAGHKAGISPEVIYYDNKITIFNYIKSKYLTSENIREKITLKRIVHLIKVVHNEVTKYLENQNMQNNIFQLINKRIFQLKKSNSPYIDSVNNYINDYKFFKKEFEQDEKVFTHNDFFYKNILDDGKKLWLVDWEYSGFNPPFLDLANLSKNNELSADDDNFILEEYCGDLADSSTIYKFYALKCVSLLNEMLWYMLSEIFSKKVFDYKSHTDKIINRYNKEMKYFKGLKI